MIVNPYVGWKFPFAFSDGRVSVAGGKATELPTQREADDATQGNLQQVVLTGKGERPMLGQFGVGADRFLFMPLTSLIPSLLSREIREQISWWMTHISITKLVPHIDPARGEVMLDLMVAYKDAPSASALKFQIRGKNG